MSYYQPSLSDAKLNALCLQGLSTPIQRGFAFYFHGLLGIGLLIALLNSPLYESAVSEGLDLAESVLQVAGFVFFLDLVRWAFFPKVTAPHQIIHRFSLLGALEERDDHAYQACLDEIDRLTTRLFIPTALKELVRYEPELRRFSFLRIAALQRRGDLLPWLTTRERIRTTGRFFYLMHLAERRRADVLAGRDTEIF